MDKQIYKNSFAIGSMDKIPNDSLLELFRTMLRVRMFEEKIAEVYSVQDMKTPVHLCVGQEAVSAGVCANLNPGDYMFTTHRGHGHCLAYGMEPKSLLAEFYGRSAGCCAGKGGSMHPADPARGILGASAIVGGAIPLSAGAALTAKMLKNGRISVGFFGDGASEEGVFQETLSFSALKKLPVVFICENNLYATNSHISARQPHDNIAKRAAAFDIPSEQVDGNDVMAVFNAAAKAIKRTRNGEGPSFIECKTYRWYGHVGPVFDYKMGCRPENELKEWKKLCPVAAFQKKLTEGGILTAEKLSEMTDAIAEEFSDAIEYARSCPLPEPSELTQHVYHESGAV